MSNKFTFTRTTYYEIELTDEEFQQVHNNSPASVEAWFIEQVMHDDIEEVKHVDCLHATPNSSATDINNLISIWESWCIAHNHPLADAEELLITGELNNDEESFVRSFINVWDTVQTP